MNKFFIFAVTVFLVGAQAMAELKMSAKEIMEKNEDNRRLANVVAKAKLVTGAVEVPGQKEKSKVKERVKEFTWWRKLKEDGKRYNTLTRFHFPPEVKGQGILFLENPDDKADVQMYLPTFKKIRRVESNQQSGSFMGSEFAYSDIATPHVDDYNYRVTKEEPCPDFIGHGLITCSVIESKPATDAVKERTGVAKALIWIRQDNFMAAQGDYYDLKGNLWKRMESPDAQLVDPKNKKWMAVKIRMENVLTKKFTSLEFSDIKVEEKIEDSTFTPQNLSRDK